MAVANTVAYYNTVRITAVKNLLYRSQKFDYHRKFTLKLVMIRQQITAVKSFILQTPGAVFTTLYSLRNIRLGQISWSVCLKYAPASLANTILYWKYLLRIYTLPYS